ncbi:MAG: hypothetical protein VYA34_15685, partial [Myxococcota bacterium]|nr:hypothetical protein [Myxococcota bacterium]
MSTPCPENSVKRMSHETKPITWIGGIRISPFKVSEDDTMSPEVVFWFDTNTGATMTCEVAYSFAAYRCLWETLGDHLMTYHRSHGRFPDNIHVVDDYCAEQIRGIVPGSIQVERRPPLELNQRIRTFVQKLMVRSEGDSKGAAVHGLSKEHTERLMVNRVVFSDLVKSLADDDFDGQWGYAGEENVTVAPGLRDLLWGPASIPPSMDFTCSVFDGGELEEEDEDNPWLGEFVENGKLPERSVRGIFQARVIAIALWDFKMNQWGNVFEGWGV